MLSMAAGSCFALLQATACDVHVALLCWLCLFASAWPYSPGPHFCLLAHRSQRAFVSYLSCGVIQLQSRATHIWHFVPG